MGRQGFVAAVAFAAVISSCKMGDTVDNSSGVRSTTPSASPATGSQPASSSAATGGLSLSAPALPAGLSVAQMTLAAFGGSTCQTLDPSSALGQLVAGPLASDFSGATPCLAQQSTSTYTVGADVALSSLPPASYVVVVVFLDANGNILQYGEASATVTAAAVAPASVTMQNYSADASGGVDITIQEPGAPAAAANAGAAAQLVIGSAALSQAVSACGPVTFQVEDASGNVAAASAAVNFTPTSTSTTGAFFSDPSCSAALTSAQIAAGQTGVVIYYADSTAGSPSLSATPDPGLAWAAVPAQQETITASSSTTPSGGSAPSFFIYGFDQALTVSAGACGVVTVDIKDHGQQLLTTGAPLTFTLSTTSSTGAFYSDSACTVAATSVTVAAGSAQASVYFKDSTVGTPEIDMLYSGSASGAPASGFVNVTN